ncbi:hypothetical protein SBOR_5890 [Sclerotinia borealis F-4128]|uniref:Uncharacterized protein n=1 Tax=Sclerotinia borealis (strain F-4128) TaxID=1432307 RepID=W9CGN4_SCLBF|nr:hypothetical protein SBOR_5890 [Sclerotinia borealis F-4128]
MAANLNANDALNFTSLGTSELPRQVFAVGLGGVLGLITWYFIYFYVVDLVFDRMDMARAERRAERQRRILRLNG